MRQGEVRGPGGSLHYVVSGRLHAPSVVLLHPLGADLQVWDGVLPELERFFAVLRVDLAGHGGSRSPLGTLASDRRMADLGMADLAAEVLAVCDELRIERAHFCGISLGGAIALEIALTAPQRVHRLVLANTAPHFPSRELWDERIEWVRERGMAPVVEAMPERWFTPEYRESHGEQIKLLAERMGRTEPLAYTQACAALKIFDRRDDLPRLSVPTWVLASTRDVVTPVEDAERWSQQIPGADLWVIDAGHLAVVEQASDFVTALLAFWRD